MQQTNARLPDNCEKKGALEREADRHTTRHEGQQQQQNPDTKTKTHYRNIIIPVYAKTLFSHKRREVSTQPASGDLPKD